MFRWLAAAAVLFPLAAEAASPIGPVLSTPTPVHDYPAAPPRDAGAAPSDGWGWRASMDGRWTDISRHGLAWSADPTAPAKDIEAGYQWRRGPASAVLGYGQFDGGANKDPALWDRIAQDETSKPGDPGVLGLSLVLRSR
ncbi:MAG TPA: hypothetical protein VHW60_06390 [Caulobacteraceae bacterium]|jgi:hypothetical protein|nr:hypothetical protein [Caulobacteraceae bacterium]